MSANPGKAGDPVSPEERYKIALDVMHKNIALGNTYRLEGIKHATTLALGALVFTVTFRKEFLGDDISVGATLLPYIGWGWFFLVLSVFGGLTQMILWSRFYLSFRDEIEERIAGKPVAHEVKQARKKTLRYLDVAAIAQHGALVLGLAILALFAVKAFSA